VDFLHSTNWVVSQARLSNYMYYSGMDFTYKLDRTIVTVGAPSMLAISTSPASARASSSTWATTGSTAPVVAEGSGLPSSVDVGGLPVPVACCADSDTISSTVGLGWAAAPLSRSAHHVPVVFFPQIHRVGRWNLLQFDCQHAMLQEQELDYSTRGTYLLGSGLCHL
jgi:hypothetical protein